MIKMFWHKYKIGLKGLTANLISGFLFGLLILIPFQFPEESFVSYLLIMTLFVLYPFLYGSILKIFFKLKDE